MLSFLEDVSTSYNASSLYTVFIQNQEHFALFKNQPYILFMSFNS